MIDRATATQSDLIVAPLIGSDADVAIGAEANGVGEADWGLNTEKRRSRVSGRDERLTHLPLIICLVVVGIVYAYFATGGSWRFRDGMGYFQALGQAFLHGHLYLDANPPAKLLELANPYDVTQRNALISQGVAIVHDALLYNGHYYLYWGPVPGLLHAAWELVTRQPLTDALAGFLAGFVVVIGGGLILRDAQQRYWPEAPSYLVWGSCLALGSGGIMLFMVGRPSVYHESQLVGLAFLFASWGLLLRAYETTERPRHYLLGSSLCLALAVASRITYLGYAASTILVLLFNLRKGCTDRRHSATDVLVYAAPLALCGVALATYNFARFGSFFDFGLSYQLAGADLPALNLGGHLLEYFAMYLVAIPEFTGSYPYFPFDGTATVFPPTQWIHVPVEPPIVSVFMLAPVTLFCITFPFIRRSTFPAAPRMLIASILFGIPFTIVLLSVAGGLNDRYSADLSPALTLAGSLLLLYWAAQRMSQRGRTRGIGVIALHGARSSIAVVCWLISIVCGAGLGFAVWQYSFPSAAMGLMTHALVPGLPWLGR